MERTEKKIDKKALLKKLSLLNDQRTRYIFSLVQRKPMVHGLPHEVYRKCGKPNCKCTKGKLHGPYSALSVNKDGGHKIVMVKQADSGRIMKQARRYKYFQRTLARIRKIDKEIVETLEQIKAVATSSYP
jgi:hypothetical protein